jgi:hypothetical protein
MRTRLIGVSVLFAALLWTAVVAQQVQPRPGFGSGVVPVEGTVNAIVANIPSVNVTNTPGVIVTNTPTVTAAPLGFIKAGGRYLVQWSAGETERVSVVALGTGGWIRVTSAQERWINLDAARGVEAVP